MNTNIIKGLVIGGAILGALAFFGLTPFGKQLTQLAIGSPTGSTFNTAKVATIDISLASPGANGTSTSLLNTDASDRKIKNFVYDCANVGTSLTAYTGAGLAGLTFTFGTTSTANPNSIGGNTNTIVLSVATSTPDSYNILGAATNTPSALIRVWPTGSYLTIQSNATNTASCLVGVDYYAS